MEPPLDHGTSMEHPMKIDDLGLPERKPPGSMDPLSFSSWFPSSSRVVRPHR
jgi:hypothetical protein